MLTQIRVIYKSMICGLRGGGWYQLKMVTQSCFSLSQKKKKEDLAGKAPILSSYPVYNKGD